MWRSLLRRLVARIHFGGDSGDLLVQGGDKPLGVWVHFAGPASAVHFVVGGDTDGDLLRRQADTGLVFTPLDDLAGAARHDQLVKKGQQVTLRQSDNNHVQSCAMGGRFRSREILSAIWWSSLSNVQSAEMLRKCS